jgi:hypothetical protein
MDLTQVDQSGELNRTPEPGPAGRQKSKKSVYVLMLLAATYFVCASFYPVLRVWERIPGLKAGNDSVSVVEDYSRAEKVFNPPPAVMKLPTNDLTDFVFSPDGHYLILLYTDIEKRHSVIQIKEVDDGESSQWKVWREYEYDFHVLAVNAYRDRIAVVMQEAETASKSLTNQPKPDESGKMPSDDYRERTFLLIYDYNGREAKRETLPGKYLQSSFSDDKIFLQTAKHAFLIQLSGDAVYRTKIDPLAGIAGCRPSKNTFICLTGDETALSYLYLSDSAAQVKNLLTLPQKILFWGEFSDYVVYYTADDVLTFKTQVSEFIFPRRLNAVNLAEIKNFNGVSYFAVYTDSRLLLFTLQGVGIGGILFDEAVEYPLSQLAFYPGRDRFMLVANQTAADFMKGELKVFNLNLQKTLSVPAEIPVK